MAHDVRSVAGNPEEGFAERSVRPWGHYVLMHRGERYLVKRICVAPRQRLSLQYHRHRAEHWVVVRGVATVTCDGTVRTLLENEAAYVATGASHRLENRGDDWLEVVEVQFGDFLDEEDIVRIEDDYRRA